MVAPRFHAQDFPDSLLLERGGVSASEVALDKRAQDGGPIPGPLECCQAILTFCPAVVQLAAAPSLRSSRRPVCAISQPHLPVASVTPRTLPHDDSRHL
jgi:hypothetical protein